MKEGKVANVNVAATTGQGLSIGHVNSPAIVLVHVGGIGLLETKVFEKGLEIEKHVAAIGGGRRQIRLQLMKGRQLSGTWFCKGLWQLRVK